MLGWGRRASANPFQVWGGAYSPLRAECQERPHCHDPVGAARPVGPILRVFESAANTRSDQSGSVEEAKERTCSEGICNRAAARSPRAASRARMGLPALSFRSFMLLHLAPGTNMPMSY